VNVEEDQDLDGLLTEAIDERQPALDAMSVPELVRLLNERDATIPAAVGAALPQISPAIAAAADRMRRGGRLIYVGAGTSGRLGVLDASEIPPTFGTGPDLVVGLIAGGPRALVSSVEAAEDDPEAGASAVAELALTADDVVVGIASSGRTPYVLGAVRFARSLGALTIGFSCNPKAVLSQAAEFPIEVTVGPEIVTGSTRMGAGTATKMVLNMISTICMIRLGKTYGTLMVDLRATNRKLVRRAVRIVEYTTGVDESAALVALRDADWQVKVAIAAIATGTSAAEARRRLDAADGMLRRVVAPASGKAGA
jgi:N-acetylmuramic acid 6-phosphate etherase